jgi:hypothetical protein
MPEIRKDCLTRDLQRRQIHGGFPALAARSLGEADAL